MTLIAQISDFHITAPGVLAYGQVDTHAALRKAVAALNALPVQPDLVIGSGDLTQSGSDAEYAALGGILQALSAPFLPLLGNHDRRGSLRRAFPAADAAIGDHRFIQYAHELGILRILVLDTVQEGADDPVYCAERMAWLTEALTDRRPTLVAMHHPPFPCGIAWLEPPDPSWSTPIGDAVAAAPHVAGLICGHVHRGMHRSWRGVRASTAPSTAHQVFLDFSLEAPPMLAHEAPGFQLHQWDADGIVTYTAAVDGAADRFSPTRSA